MTEKVKTMVYSNFNSSYEPTIEDFLRLKHCGIFKENGLKDYLVSIGVRHYPTIYFNNMRMCLQTTRTTTQTILFVWSPCTSTWAAITSIILGRVTNWTSRDSMADWLIISRGKAIPSVHSCNKAAAVMHRKSTSFSKRWYETSSKCMVSSLSNKTDYFKKNYGVTLLSIDNDD